jgi:1-acyl-sn-glycerol-3-phosphate acyltransferase
MLRLIVYRVPSRWSRCPLMPLQWLAIALKRPAARRIPVFYHRFVCRLLGIRVRAAVRRWRPRRC